MVEETRYENKTNDMIWLELQAWFAGMRILNLSRTLSYCKILLYLGMDPMGFDQKLMEMREGVPETIREVLTFRFRTDEEDPGRSRDSR